MHRLAMQAGVAVRRIGGVDAIGFLRPGMFVDVRFSAQLADDAVHVPDMTVLRSGERNTVFVALDGGYFEAREVKLGARSDGNNYEVLSGLQAGERVVVEGTQKAVSGTLVAPERAKDSKTATASDKS